MCSRTMTMQSSLASASTARHWVRRFMEDFFIPFNDDFILAVGEAVSNAAVHGPPQPAVIKLLISYDPTERQLVCEASDFGKGFDWEGLPLRENNVDGTPVFFCGRFLMSQGCDSVSYERRGTMFVCRLTKKV